MSRTKTYTNIKDSKNVSSTRYRSNLRKRRPLNRFEAEGNPESASISAKKLKLNCEEEENIEVKDEFGYRILNFFAIFSVISEHVKCKTCGSNVSFTQTSPRGLGFKIIISCGQCAEIAIPSCPLRKNGFEINRQIILAMRILRVGLGEIEKFCAFMNMPRPTFHSFYDKIVDMISIATATVRDLSMKNAMQKEQKRCQENGQLEGITVSADGSWRKRGFTSLFEITSLIRWYSGKMIDVEVKSKYCKACEH